MGEIALDVEETAAGRTIRVRGELDLHNVGKLGELLSDCERQAVAHVVLDLSGLEFIDSSGVVLLLCAHRRLNADRVTRLRFIPSPALAVRRVMSISGLDGKLPTLAGAAA